MSAAISVVIPAFNAERHIQEAIESVLMQTLPAKEILVVDDGSTDATAQIVRKFEGQVILVQQPNSGVSHARNVAFARACSDWVCFLDADDTWQPNKLAVSLEYAEKDPLATLVFSDYQTFGLQSRAVRLAETFANWRRDMELLSPIVCVLPSAAMVRRTVSARFPEWASVNEDAIYFNDLADEGTVIHVPQLLVNYRQHASSAQKQVGVGERAGANMLQRYASDPKDRARFAHTLLTMMKQRRESRKWHDFDAYFRILQDHWSGDRRIMLQARATHLSKYIYKLKDCLERLKPAHPTE